MKRVVHFILLGVFITLLGCEKDHQILEPENIFGISDSQIQELGNFKKEIVVNDISGKNQAFYAIYSDDEGLLNDFIRSHELTLSINVDNIVNTVKSAEVTSTENHSKDNNYDNFNLTDEPKLFIELVTTNLQEDVENYTLDINTRSGEEDYLPGYPIGYTTRGDFIGVVHLGFGYEFIVQYTAQKNFLSRPKQVLGPNGENSWFVWPHDWMPYYSSFSAGEYYRRSLIIRPHYYYNTINYQIVYDSEDYRSRNCQIGRYDYNNYGECYVGTAPAGTRAFIWGNNNGLNFYYTPVDGNKCPRAGSWFDGANCYVMKIPETCEPYTWQRNWLVRSDLL